ncbi:hypothetical protein JHK86_023747 [Glycine max]|uniref:Uncharacterized protein n=1 Tax=Glycine max TaxID=3847 RepID=A0A0R0I1W0_SOYBN|nr:hypothetical protein JHK86_023747 [Glycine max]
MASFSITGPIKCKRITSFFPLSFSTTYNSCNISIPRNITRKVRARSNTLSLFSYQSSMHRSLYYEKQRGLSLIAFDGNNSESEGEDGHHGLDSVMKLYSAFKNKKIHELSADERRRVSNFLSFFETFQGRTGEKTLNVDVKYEISNSYCLALQQVLEFFSYLTSILGNNIQIIFKPTPHEGVNAGLQWKFEWDKIHLPLWKGFSLHISHTYHGRAVIRNIETFMEPLLHLRPFGLKMKIGLREFVEKIASFMVSEFGNKAKRILYLVLAVSSLTAFLFFMKLAL